MEEVTSWKGQTFTLVVFTGIVVLASIFFILGMLVGRAQGQKVSTSDLGPVLKAEAKSAAGEDKQPLTFYDSVKKEPPAEFERAPAKLDPPSVPSVHAGPAKPEPVRESSPVARPSSSAASSAESHLVNYQVGAVRKPGDAEKFLEDVKRKGFRAFIVPPAPGDPNPYFRIHVGPFSDPTEAQDMKKRLERAGFRPMPRK